MTEEHDLGAPDLVGEKALLASQRAVRAVNAERGSAVRQIAASMRDGRQVAELAGTDVYTMPLKVADAARSELEPLWQDRTEYDPEVTITDADARADRQGRTADLLCRLDLFAIGLERMAT